MKLFIIVCMLIMVGYIAYSYKVILDIAKHIEETLIAHDIEIAKYTYLVQSELCEKHN